MKHLNLSFSALSLSTQIKLIPSKTSNMSKPLGSIVASLLPRVIQENYDFSMFILILTNLLLLMHWVVSTSWDSKFNWCSFIIGATAIFHLHYANVTLIHQYELLFVSAWFLLFCYHLSTWRNNCQQVNDKLQEKSVISSLRPYKGSILSYFIKVPIEKNADGQWKAPTMGNAVHVIMIMVYGMLFYLHVIPFVTPLECLGAQSSLCCRYNYAIEGFDTQSVNKNFCSGRVRIAFVGSWSTGKTSIINALLGHEYSTSQIAPAPTTDKFVCLALGATYSAPIASDDFSLRRHCEIISHINDVTHSTCGEQLPNVVDVADDNTEFSNFVFFDTPGWQTEYMNNCRYESFYRQLIDKMDFIYVVWDLHHGKIEDHFADFFKSKTKGTNYELIYNRYDDQHADMSFLNQQYAKMTNGQEILSEMYTMKLHENSTQYENQYVQDIQLLRAKIMSVNQTVYDNRKTKMKSNLMSYKSKITGLLSLRKVSDTIEEMMRHK